MPRLAQLYHDSQPVISVLLGGITVLLFSYVWITGGSPSNGYAQLLQIFGTVFIACIGTVLLAALYAAQRLRALAGDPQKQYFWIELGRHLADGTITLGLTYTLLGLSGGLSALASQPLSPEHVGQMIQSLSNSFQLALLSTIVALPLGTIIRAYFCLCEAAYPVARENRSIGFSKAHHSTERASP